MGWGGVEHAGEVEKWEKLPKRWKQNLGKDFMQWNSRQDHLWEPSTQVKATWRPYRKCHVSTLRRGASTNKKLSSLLSVYETARKP